MSNLKHKLERLYHAGMAGPAPALFPDPRTAGQVPSTKGSLVG